MKTDNDIKLLATIKDNLYTAVVGDVMDQMGFQNQFLSPRIKPLRDDMIVVGRAMTAVSYTHLTLPTT